MTKLYTYQREGIEFLKSNKRIVLADQMGLGKTVEALFAAFELGCKRVLILCPNSLKGVWKDQIEQWICCTPRYKSDPIITIVEGSASDREILLKLESNYTIINYDLIGPRTYNEGTPQERTDLRHSLTLGNIEWDCIICDESHRMKNRRSATFKGAKWLVREFPNIPLFLLTGTPLMNSVEELWPLLHLINRYKYSSFWRWVEEYCNTVPSEYSKYGKNITGIRDPEKVRNDIRPIFLRRLKDDVLELPEKSYIHYPVELYPTQRALYNSMLRRMFVEIDFQTIDAVSALAQVTRLRQIAIAPEIIIGKTDNLTGAKIDAVMEILEDLGGQQAVIFSGFRTVIDGLVKKLGREKIPHQYFTGQIRDIPERLRRIAKFISSPDIPAMLMTIQTGGEGFTLVPASVVIFVDVMWNPARNAQAVDRLHRIGQQNKVTIYNIVAHNTIESRILRLLKNKQDIFDAVIPVERIHKLVLQALEEEVNNYD